MRLPGYTAEATVYQRTGKYRITPSRGSLPGGPIVTSQLQISDAIQPRVTIPRAILRGDPLAPPVICMIYSCREPTGKGLEPTNITSHVCCASSFESWFETCGRFPCPPGDEFIGGEIKLPQVGPRWDVQFGPGKNLVDLW